MSEVYGMKVDGYIVKTETKSLIIDIEQNRKEITDEIVTSLIAERKRLGYTQQDVADISGMKAPNVTRIESRKYSPSLDVLMRYANALGKKIYLGLKDGRDVESSHVAESVIYQGNHKRAFPIGISDYKRISRDYYYVDKTLLIRDLLDEQSQVMLFTRPRRFGKTLNMDMLRVFFEKTQEDTSVYFKDKLIWKCGERYQEYQGKYPVIFITFKDVKFRNWEDTFVKLRKLFSDEACRHMELRESDQCSAFDKQYFENMLSQELDFVDLADAFMILSRMLHAHHGVAPIIIVDEYDIPIQQGYVNGYYEDAVAFIRNLFSGGFKDNSHLSFGYMTGILRVAQESIFSGLNNIRVNSILEDSYSEYFGFTPEEVKAMCIQHGASDKYQEISEWYDGYCFGDKEIFNPWSVINYFTNKYKTKAYWLYTSSNDIIAELLEKATPDVCEHLKELIDGNSIIIPVSTDVIYPQIRNNPVSIFSFLLMTGYLKVEENDLPPEMDGMYGIAIPNKEIASVYKKEILAKMTDHVPISTTVGIQEALSRMEVDALQENLQKFLWQTVSYYDTQGENFYHGLVLGLCAMMDSHYAVTSNREAGEGRYDVQLMPKMIGLPGIIIELKYKKDVDEEELRNISRDALKQIDERKYDTQMKEAEISSIYKYGVAFSGKRVEIACSVVGGEA